MLHHSFFKSLLAGAFALAGSATFAQTATPPDQIMVLVYPISQANKICLEVKKQPNAFVSVQLLTPTGEVLYQDHLPKKGDRFSQVFDMNQLKDGVYTLRIKQGKDVIVKSIQLQTSAPAPAIQERFLTLGN
ncbi:hypothetical protein [Spirosoma luteum]|uniref:hypothetical protein n=1 Tax=Spirosoma luteum TaxID=431553 RepID=UPI000369396A|nr:hypothetical protein [Spirosoma luteum]